MNRHCLILTGMPGSGKSTVGPMLADKLDMPFIDSDKIIEGVYGVRLEDITKAFGREQFLDAECKIIQAINLSGCVIATGGSVIYREPAMTWLKRMG
ncbi:MAG: dephospho-CoA kinase, partial [Desulfovibrio sp.]|nr:dephospho-CoA kinase [Desulfovibrio sp.]